MDVYFMPQRADRVDVAREWCATLAKAALASKLNLTVLLRQNALSVPKVVLMSELRLREC